MAARQTSVSLVLTAGPVATLVVALLLSYGWTLAGHRDDLVARLASRALAPPVAIAVRGLSVGRVALDRAGGPAEVQGLWIAGVVAGAGSRGETLGWDEARLEFGWETAIGRPRMTRVVLNHARLDTADPAAVVRVLSMLPELVPASSEPDRATIRVTGGRLSGPPGDAGAPLPLSGLSGGIRSRADGGWSGSLHGRAADGERVMLVIALGPPAAPGDERALRLRFGHGGAMFGLDHGRAAALPEWTRLRPALGSDPSTTTN